MTWRDKAACRGMDPNEFHPDPRHGGKSPGDEGTAEARAICHGCPVRVDCLANALTAGESLGVWGGTTPHERNRLRSMLRADSQWAHLPDDAPHPAPRVVLGLSRPQRRRILAEEMAERNGRPAPYGEAKRLAERFGVDPASISLDMKWLRERETEEAS